MSLEDRIRNNKEAFKVNEISQDLWDKIDENLNLPSKKNGNLKRLFISISSVAAVGLICLFFYQNYQQNLAIKQELMAMKSTMNSMLNDQSSFKRIRAVNMSSELPSVDNEVIDALIRTMNDDKNENVQLAAVNALENFVGKESVKKALLEALATTNEPFFKIKVIKLLSNTKDERALPFLNQIIDDEASQGYLKDEAENAKQAIKSL